jgi:hypothetical protein
MLLYVGITESGPLSPDSLLSLTADRVGSGGGGCIVPVTLSVSVLPLNDITKSVFDIKELECLHQSTVLLKNKYTLLKINFE